MRNKFTQTAESALVCAQELASELGHSYIGTEHLLYALSAAHDSISAKILSMRGVSDTKIKQDIIDDMLAGLDNEQRKKVISIVDRKEAIRTACALAQKGDVVVVAGKGHEDYQVLKDETIYFDEKVIVQNLLKK